MEEQAPTPDMSFFLASSVHDMKNSLNLLSGQVECFLSDYSQETFPGYNDLAQMLYETKRVNHHLIQLLALYKLGNNLYPFDPQPFLISDFVQDMHAQCAPLLVSRKIVLEISIQEDVIWYFDEELIHGIIGQAINNASQYTKDHIRIATQIIDGMLEISVEDNGRGYPPGMLELGKTDLLGVSFGSGSTGLGLHFGRIVAAMHKNKGRHGTLTLANGGYYGGGCCILRLP